MEANVPAPASPFEGLTIDELSVFLLEEYSEVLARDDMPEEIRADAKRHIARITGQITETVNFASGRWAMMPGFDNYQEHLANWRKRWEKVRPDESEFVPSLNHNIEGDGFGRPEPVTPCAALETMGASDRQADRKGSSDQRSSVEDESA